MANNDILFRVSSSQQAVQNSFAPAPIIAKHWSGTLTLCFGVIFLGSLAPSPRPLHLPFGGELQSILLFLVKVRAVADPGLTLGGG